MAIHPGEVLADDLEALNISVEQLAASIGFDARKLQEIVSGRAPFTAELATLTEACIGVPAYIYMSFQQDYDLYQEHHKPSMLQRLASIPRLARQSAAGAML